MVNLEIRKQVCVTSDGPQPVTRSHHSDDKHNQVDNYASTPQEPLRGKSLAFHMSFLSLLIMGFICALDATVLGVAIPSIVHELDGSTLEGFWASISFLLAVVIVQPLYTSVSNVVGRKMPLYISYIFFIAGSIIFGLSQSMAVLIAGRTLQGFGAGGLDVLNEIILADITTLKERPMYLGYFSIPMLAGTVLGPVLGGVFSQNVTWRWIGWINLPLSAIGLVLAIIFMRLKTIDQPLRMKLRRLDWRGIVLFTVGCTLFATPIAWAGGMFPWSSYKTIVPLILGLILLIAFLRYEKTPVEPVLPYRMFNDRTAFLTLLAVGFRDVFGALGRLDENEFGTDCAGKVTRVGSKCTQLRPGDRVSTSMFGCMRTYVYCDEGDAIKVPDTLSLDEACGVINPVMTAWHSLVDVARLQKGEKILIHAATGGTGQVAIQVAQMLGAEVYATVGYDHKKELLIKKYGIPATNIFYSRDLSFAQGIMRVTKGYGVDVVLNSLVGEGQKSSWECVAPYGRFVEIGKADIYANSPLPMASFAHNRTFSAVDLRDLAFHRPEASRALFHRTMNLVQEKAIFCPTPLNKFPVSAIEDAFRYMQTGRSTGRVIVTLDHGDVVPKNLIHRPAWTFDSEAAYLVVGGLGGVGRSILRWMISRGAKQLIVPSRSGPRCEAAFKIVIDAIKSGVTILTPSCDVSDMASLKLMLDECAPVVGPIRGCINAAMVLQDSIFDNMTHAQWKKTIDSKVKSSWNLHAVLPNDLDFFILLSSAAGVLGNAGQSNYAAGCTFQDALSSFRKSQGRKTVSIDLGLMSTVGFVAENEGVKKTLERYEGLRAIDEAEFLALMDILCDLEHPPNISTINGQVTMGITTPADLALDNGTMPMEHMHQSLFAYFVQTEAMASSSMQANGVNSAALFRQAESVEEMDRIVVESLVRKIARALSMSLEDVDTDKALHLYGVDSLVAVEIRNWITKEFMADVPVFELMSGKSILAIAQLVTKNSQIRKTVAKA